MTTIIAIDFGTSNTVVGLLDSDTNKAKLLRLPEISRIYKLKKTPQLTHQVPVIPSLLFVSNQQQLVIGEKVRSFRLGSSQPQRLFKNFKRDLAADFQPPPRYFNEKKYDVKLVAELFIREIWQKIKDRDIQPEIAIFTVPVGSFEPYLDWYQDLAGELKINQVKFIDESTAAALGYGIKKPNSLVLVIDFGGGTLDLSLIRILPQTLGRESSETETLKAQVLAKSDAYVGGEDIDSWIVEDYLRQQGWTREHLDSITWQSLLELAERLKIRLSQESKVQESWLDEKSFTSYEIELTKTKLAKILENEKLLEQLRNALDEIINLALSKGIKKNEIEQVILVGGTCFVSAVQQLIVAYFGKQKVKFEQPFSAVCTGALALTQIREVEDYLRHTYAIRLYEPLEQTYTYYPLFTKGTNYPCQRKEPLILQVANDGQTEIKLDLGELADVQTAEVEYDQQGRISSSSLQKQQVYHSLENQAQEVCIAHLEIPGQIGVDRLQVNLEVSANRILIVTVKDLLTNQILVEKQAIGQLK